MTKNPPKLTMRQQEDLVLEQARAILEKRIRRAAYDMSRPEQVFEYLRYALEGLEREVFGMIYLNIKNKFIRNEILFYGTLAHTAVYPREVAKAALKHNAAAVIIYHNHPSGECTPTETDIMLTNTLRTSLSMLDVRVVDHIIVGGASRDICSFSQKGLL